MEWGITFWVVIHLINPRAEMRNFVYQESTRKDEGKTKHLFFALGT